MFELLKVMPYLREASHYPTCSSIFLVSSLVLVQIIHVKLFRTFVFQPRHYI